MPQTDQLTALKVKRAKPRHNAKGEPIGYRLTDGKQTGLYLAVSPTGAKSWVYMWERNGRRRVMGLGSEKALSLADAREDAAEAYRDVRKGLDPIAERNKRKGRIGPAIKWQPSFPARCSSSHWRTPSAMPPSKPTVAAPAWRNAGS